MFYYNYLLHNKSLRQKCIKMVRYIYFEHNNIIIGTTYIIYYLFYTKMINFNILTKIYP